MKRKELLNAATCVYPHNEDIDTVLAKSAIIMSGDEQYLNINLFYNGELKAQYFTGTPERSYATYMDGKWTTNSIINISRKIKGDNLLRGNDFWYLNHGFEYDTERDRKIAENYLGRSLNHWEECCRTEKSQTALERKEQRIAKLMDTVPLIPKEVEQWVLNDVFPDNFLFTEQAKERNIYHCTACGKKSWRKKPFKHGEKISCPKCGKLVKVEKKRKIIIRKDAVILLQIINNNTWVERQFKVVCTWRNNEKTLEMFEETRALVPAGCTYGKLYYGTQYNANELDQEFWDKKQFNKAFVNSYLYPGNLTELLPFIGLERRGMEILALRNQKFDVNKFILTASKRPWYENMAKNGFMQLLVDVIKVDRWWGEPKDIFCLEGRSVQAFLQLDAYRVTRLKNINGGLNVLEWLRYEQKMRNNGSHIKMTDETLSYLSQKKISLHDCEDILKELGSVNRMVNYMKKQTIAPSRFLTIWRDYLHMASAEGLDLTDDIVRLPKDLKGKHDELVGLRNIRLMEKRKKEEEEKFRKLDASIKKYYPMVTRYEWEDKEYKVIPAAKCEELILESRQLHHCVGTSSDYMKKMAEGRSWILFLRKKINLEESYYTIELDMQTKEIKQWYSTFDRQPDKKTVSKVLKHWLNDVVRNHELRT